MDVNEQAYLDVGKSVIESDKAVAAKIQRHIRPAIETLGMY